MISSEGKRFQEL